MYYIRKRWRRCVICGNRTRSLKRVGTAGNFIWGYYPWVVCGERCDTFARLLPLNDLHDRIDKRIDLDDCLHF